MVRIAFLLVLVTLGSACGRRRVGPSITGPGMNNKREAQLLQQAEAQLQCHEGLVGAFEGSLETNYHAYRVDGCGKRFHALLHCTGICNWRQGPERLAESDLQCPAIQLSRTYSAQTNTFEVTGCGRSARYELGQGKIRRIDHAAVPVGPPPPTGTVGPPPPPPPAPPAAPVSP